MDQINENSGFRKTIKLFLFQIFFRSIHNNKYSLLGNISVSGRIKKVYKNSLVFLKLI